MKDGPFNPIMDPPELSSTDPTVSLHYATTRPCRNGYFFCSRLGALETYTLGLLSSNVT